MCNIAQHQSKPGGLSAKFYVNRIVQKDKSVLSYYRMAQQYENMPEDQLRQDRADRRATLDKAPGATAEQQFMKEAAAAVNKLQEHLEDKVRAVPPPAEGQEAAALRVLTAKRKVATLATKWATRLQVAAKVIT
jgi:hypothetical protein